MAIEYRNRGYQHRCTDCGAEWADNDTKPLWLACRDPEGHGCHKCPDEPEPAEPECGTELWHSTSWQALYGWRYCPRCGVALTRGGT